MPISTFVKTKRDGTLLIEDGAGTPKTLTIDYEAGDFKLSIPGPSITPIMDRGVFTALQRKADDQPMTFSFTAQLRDLSDAAYITLESILANAGYFASTWVSIGGASAEVKTVKLTWTIEGTTPDGADHTCVLSPCFITGELSEGDVDTVSITGTCYAVYPTLT